MELLADPQAWLAFATLVALELVLGIDNIIFIPTLADKLPAARREAIRRLGLLLAMVMRVALLAVLAWLVGLTEPLFHLLRHPISGCACGAAPAFFSITPSTTSTFFAPTVSGPIRRRLVVPL